MTQPSSTSACHLETNIRCCTDKQDHIYRNKDVWRQNCVLWFGFQGCETATVEVKTQCFAAVFAHGSTGLCHVSLWEQEIKYPQ